MKAKLTIELEAHEWYPGEPCSATIALPPLAYSMELIQARLDADSPVLPKAWRANPAALVGARMAAIALRLPISAVIATAHPLSTGDGKLSTGDGAPVDTGTGGEVAAPAVGRLPWEGPPVSGARRRLVRVLRCLTWVGLAVTLGGLLYGWARYR